MTSRDDEQPTPAPRTSHETTAFIFLAVVLFPLLSIALVGGFGFVVWMSHLLSGPM